MKEIELIHKYLSGNASQQETALLKEWINVRPQNQAFFEMEKRIWEVSGQITPAIDVNTEAALARFKMRHRISDTRRRPATSRFGLNPHRMARIAASLGLLIAASCFLLLSSRVQLSEEIANTEQQPKVLDLADGSRLILNEGATVALSRGFAKSNRKLRLTGEAYFTVKPSQSEAFVVHLGEFDATVKVIGTRFNLKADSRNKSIALFVEEGSVEFSARSSTYILKGGDEMHYDFEVGRINIQKPGSSNASAWATRKLHFQNASLHEVIRTLEAVYKGRVSIEKDCLADLKLSSTLDIAPQENLLDAIRPIARVLNLTVEITQEGIVVLKGPCL